METQGPRGVPASLSSQRWNWDSNPGPTRLEDCAGPSLPEPGPAPHGAQGGARLPCRAERPRGQRRWRGTRSRGTWPVRLGGAPLGHTHTPRHSPGPFVRPSSPPPGAPGTRSRGPALPDTHCSPSSPRRRALRGRLQRSLPRLLSPRLSHRPGATGSGAHCGAAGSASRTQTWSQLTRLLMSLLPRPQAMLLVPSTWERPLPSGHMVSQAPGSRVPDRQAWLRANACPGPG